MLNSCLICTKTLQISLFRIFNQNIQQFQVIKIQVSCFKWYNCVKGIATIGNICYIRRLTQLGRCKQLNAHTHHLISNHIRRMTSYWGYTTILHHQFLYEKQSLWNSSSWYHLSSEISTGFSFLQSEKTQTKLFHHSFNQQPSILSGCHRAAFKTTQHFEILYLFMICADFYALDLLRCRQQKLKAWSAYLIILANNNIVCIK